MILINLFHQSQPRNFHPDLIMLKALESNWSRSVRILESVSWRRWRLIPERDCCYHVKAKGLILSGLKISNPIEIFVIWATSNHPQRVYELEINPQLFEAQLLWSQGPWDFFPAGPLLAKHCANTILAAMLNAILTLNDEFMSKASFWVLTAFAH